MNIYKHLYSILKEKLFEFGKRIIPVQYDDLYWKFLCDEFEKCAIISWEAVISDYSYRCCDEEYRRFIDLYFFKKQTLTSVSTNFPLCERACQEWREEILKNLCGLAMQAGLLYIDTHEIQKRRSF